MKCPKCNYLGFERVDRCRNCGYDFSLAQAYELPELPELTMRQEREEPQGLDDYALVDAAAAPKSDSMRAEFGVGFGRMGAGPAAAAASWRARATPAISCRACRDRPA